MNYQNQYQQPMNQNYVRGGFQQATVVSQFSD